MKKREKKDTPKPDYRGYANDILKNYQEEVNLVRKIPKSVYSREGGVRKNY
jgi:hypothetical protein